jgi:predicted ATPase
VPGHWVGTPDYVAPEQLRGESVDRRADVYGLGCVLFQTLTGRVPFSVTSPTEKLVAHLSLRPPLPSAELPSLGALDEVIERALAKTPNERFATAGELAAAATAAVEAPRRPRARRARPPLEAIPAPPTPTFGRASDVGAVCDLLAKPEVRYVTLTGTGGVGKTRLAVEVARAVSGLFADGVRFAWLSAVNDPGRVASSVIEQLGARPEGTDPAAELVRLLGRKEVLLVLDNFEHVLAAAPLVDEIRTRCEGVKLVTTSREPLRLVSEHVYQVAPLDAGAACALFIDRAEAHDPAFSASRDDLGTIAAICRRLDGVPLAVELAAGRTVLFSPDELLARLDNALAILGDGARDAPARQRTLRATIDWSYALLDEDEAAAFAALAVFARGADLEAVDVITGASAGTLAALVAKGLVVRSSSAHGRTRLRLPETVHEYAAERLAQLPAANALRATHCRYFVNFAEQAELGLRSRHQREWASRLDNDLENLRAAISWALREEPPETGLRLAGAVGLFLGYQRGQLGEVKGWLEAALGSGQRVRPGLHAKASLALAVALQNLGQMEPALQRCRDAVQLYASAGDARGEAQALAELSFMEFESPTGGESRAAVAGVESLRIARVAGDDWVTLFALCANLWLARDLDAAKRVADEALAIARRLGVLDQQAMLLSNIGFRALEDGDYAYAREATADAVDLHRRQVDDVAGFAVSLGNLGLVAAMSGDDQEADTALRETLKTCREHGLARPCSEALIAMAALAARAADPVRAARLCGAAASLACDAPTTTDRELEGEARGSGRAVLGDERWEREWDHGRGLGFDDAIAYALGEVEPAVAV